MIRRNIRPPLKLRNGNEGLKVGQVYRNPGCESETSTSEYPTVGDAALPKQRGLSNIYSTAHRQYLVWALKIGLDSPH
jgi:hypothetical protein